jgi:predicted lipid-binding transport protein (Tim44 family)
MKKIMVALMVIVTTLAIVMSEAQAQRLGGGRNIGRQSPVAAQKAPVQQQQARQSAPQAPTAAPPVAPPKPPSPWRGILGGALLGLGLGALLSHMGIGGGLASMISTFLMIALLGFAVVFIYRMFIRKKESDVQPAAYAGGYPGGYSGGGTPDIGSRLEPQASYQPEPAYVPYGVPADFDIGGFLRSAKAYFIRLQTSWDRADVNDIREFTSPEMFAELKMQLQERGATENVTDVVTLDAELLGIETQGNEQMASVQFWGTMREAMNAPALEFAEVWNLTRPLSGPGGWVLAGIQHSS